MEVCLIWKGVPSTKDVSIAGFDDWKSHKKMNKSPVDVDGKSVWKYNIKLSTDKSHEFKFLVDGNWTLSNDYSVNSNKNNVISPSDILQAVERDQKLKSIHPLLRMFENRVLSDIKITVKPSGHVFHAHKAVLANGSEIFYKMFTGEWKEKQATEMEIQCELLDSAETFEHFLRFFYTGNLPDCLDATQLECFIHLAMVYEVEDIQSLVTKHIRESLNVQICISVLPRISQFRDSEKLKAILVPYAASNASQVFRQKESLKISLETIEEILNDENLSLPNGNMISDFLLKWMKKCSDPIASISLIRPFLQPGYFPPKSFTDGIGNAIVVFFADGSDKYTPMTIYAMRSLLKNTPKLMVGLLTPNKQVRAKVIGQIPIEYRCRILCKNTSTSHIEGGNPTQFKLDIEKFSQFGGFNSIFWMDSDCIVRSDITKFILGFTNSDSFLFMVRDHVMNDPAFQRNWKSHHNKETVIPQACLMGFKASIIRPFFRLWKEIWQSWLTPKPFGLYPDPNPQFIGSEFCIEQYALGMALQNLELPKLFNLKNPMKIMWFVRELISLNGTVDSNLTSSRMSVGQSVYKFALSNQSLKATSQGWTGQVVIDKFGPVFHCYNQNWEVAKNWLEANWVPTD
eukprot:TRINITY_DN5048_c0_g1_i2.p1 TRINITY_DN5048_c0_g1~~TRINITY_DN5048_c0_g1_i2.p1  ORF type:complete len:628 (+),score=106.95 TRINITY_DN5048_c0_g1_i2:1109-2992(+)